MTQVQITPEFSRAESFIEQGATVSRTNPEEALKLYQSAVLLGSPRAHLLCAYYELKNGNTPKVALLLTEGFKAAQAANDQGVQEEIQHFIQHNKLDMPDVEMNQIPPQLIQEANQMISGVMTRSLT